MRAEALPSRFCGLCAFRAPAPQNLAQGAQDASGCPRLPPTHTPLTPPHDPVGSFLPSSPSLIPCSQHSFILDCHPHHGTSMCLLAGHPMHHLQPYEPINVDCLFLSISLLLGAPHMKHRTRRPEGGSQGGEAAGPLLETAHCTLSSRGMGRSLETIILEAMRATSQSSKRGGINKETRGHSKISA